MRITYRKKSKPSLLDGRFIKHRDQVFKITSAGIGASASGGGGLPEGTDDVSIVMHASDGDDMSTSTRMTVHFNLDDSPDTIHALIGKLTDLLAHQQRIKRGA